MNDKNCIEMTRIWKQQQMANSGCGTPLYVSIVLFIIMLLSSCATKTVIEYRDRDVNHYITKEVHDTLTEKVTDSVYYEVVTKGDTVYKTKYKEKIHWRDRIVEKHDTCWRDSVVTEYKEKTKEVVKYPKTYWWFLAFTILFAIFAISKLIRWLRRR